MCHVSYKYSMKITDDFLVTNHKPINDKYTPRRTHNPLAADNVQITTYERRSMMDWESDGQKEIRGITPAKEDM